MQLLPLAHPAAPARYQRCHENWAEQLALPPRKKAASPKRRVPVPPTRADEVLVEADRTCVVCRRRGEVQIHHLDEDPANNDFANLVTVCANCHADVHGSAGYSRKLTSSQLRRMRDDWYESVRERKAQGHPRHMMADGPDFEMVVDAVAVVRVREIAANPTSEAIAALRPFADGFGPRVVSESLWALRQVLLRQCHQREVVREACSLMSSFLPIVTLVGPQAFPYSADELAILDQACEIARGSAYHAARQSHDLVSLDASGRIVWEVLRLGVLNDEEDLRRVATSAFDQLERACARTDFEDGRRWVRFLRQDAEQFRTFSGEYPSDVAAKLRSSP